MLIQKDKPFYSVVQVAEILGISSDRLRTYDEEYLVVPAREPNNKKRLYSELDIEWLQSLRKLISKNKLNIFSFKIILKMLYLLPDKEFENLIKNGESNEIWNIIADMKSNPNYEKLRAMYN
ncbi:MerR family transcriptional regulator [bacterium]|nr:MerR family transcriptional regulator [bacterium]